MPHTAQPVLPAQNQAFRQKFVRSLMPGERVNGACSKETTANTVRLPYSFSRRFSLWHGAKRRWRSSMCIRCRSLFAGAATGAERALYAAANRRGQFEQRLNAVWQRDSSEARQLWKISVPPRTFLPSLKNCRKRRSAGK